MTIFPTGYKNAHLCDLQGAGMAAVATADETSDVYFTRSGDGGATWSTPALVGTLSSGAAAQVLFTSRAGFVVTNGIDSHWRSDDGGRTWSAF